MPTIIPLFILFMGLVFPILLLLRLVRGKSNPSSYADFVEETRMIQEMHQGFIRMEERIEALETILIGREKVSY